MLRHAIVALVNRKLSEDKAMTGSNVWDFKTANFRVALECTPDYELDLSWDEDGSVLRDLENGNLFAFVAKVAVYDLTTGNEIGADYLGSCIYKSVEDFIDHREVGRYNRELAAKGETARCGSYFRQMVTEAISEARKYQNRPRVALRNV